MLAVRAAARVRRDGDHDLLRVAAAAQPDVPDQRPRGWTVDAVLSGGVTVGSDEPAVLLDIAWSQLAVGPAFLGIVGVVVRVRRDPVVRVDVDRGQVRALGTGVDCERETLPRLPGDGR